MDFRRVFFVVFLAGQLLIPLTQMPRAKPARFAWQMFSGTRAPIQIKLKTDAGTKEIDAKEMVGNWRGDLSFEKHLPPFLCRRFPESSSILFYYLESDTPTEFPCAR